jgi:hypothetical protein
MLYVVYFNVNFNILKQINCALVGVIKDWITSECTAQLWKKIPNVFKCLGLESVVTFRPRIDYVVLRQRNKFFSHLSKLTGHQIIVQDLSWEADSAKLFSIFKKPKIY